MVSLSEPNIKQTLNLRSIKHFRIACLFLNDIWTAGREEREQESAKIRQHKVRR